MSAFNARRARAKRPCPLWVDAFQRDTQHLQADEVGAYMLLLMAMWTRESCDFPDDDKRLAQVARVSKRLWVSRVGPVLRDFLTASEGVLMSRRLRQEAAYVEDFCQRQHDRRKGTGPESDPYAEPQGTRNSNEKDDEKSDKPLECNEQGPTAEMTADPPRPLPSQQPNNPTVRDNHHRQSVATSGAGDDDDAPDPTAREQMLKAIRVDPSGLTGRGGTMLGGQADMDLARRWASELGLTLDEICSVIRDVMARKPGGNPPSSFAYFTQAMQEAAGRKAAPALTAITGGRHGQSSGERTERLRRIISAAAEGTSGSGWG